MKRFVEDSEIINDILTSLCSNEKKLSEIEKLIESDEFVQIIQTVTEKTMPKFIYNTLLENFDENIS